MLVKDDDVEIRDAKHLWGKTITETEVRIKEETSPFTRVLSIGPAGEKLVRYACINQEYFYSASRCGGGAVMGSKRLKAVAARGTLDIPLIDPDAVFEMEEETFQKLRSDSTFVYSRGRWGSTTANISSSDSSTGPLKNWRESYWGYITFINKTYGFQLLYISPGTFFRDLFLDLKSVASILEE